MTPEQHDERWPWCAHRNAGHTHTEQLNGPSLVNGRPAGPLVLLEQRRPFDRVPGLRQDRAPRLR